MKLIIDIPEERLNSIKRFGMKQNDVSMLERALLISGTPLDFVIEDIEAEIESHIIDSNGLDFNSALYISLEIIDKHIREGQSR